MAYITPIGSNPEQVNYRLGGGHGCTSATVDRQFSYRADSRERPLRWIGRGLEAVGIEAGAELAEDQFDAARALMRGLDPRTGEVLVDAKRGVPDDAKVPLSSLVRMVYGIAAEANVSVAEVLGNRRKLVDEFERAERSVARKGEAARLRADEAGKIADAAGLSVEQVWGEDVYEQAAANLWETRKVRGEDGKVTEERVSRRTVVGNAGYDVTLTLPKSMSMLTAFAPADTAAEVEAIYVDAATRSFGWLEKNTAYGMRGKHGGGKTARVVDGNGFLGWTMIHRAARPVNGAEVGDPHWHVHISIANMTQAEDGTWSTVAAGGRDLMRHANALDHIMKAQVRSELHRRWGIQFERSARTGAWEVVGIPDETLVQFSKRHADIKQMLTELGYDEESATRAQDRIAEQRSRGQKGEAVAAADATLQDIWQGEELAAGRDPAEQMRRVFHGGSDPGNPAGGSDDPPPPPSSGPANAVIPSQRGSMPDRVGSATPAMRPTETPTAAEIADELCDPETGLTAYSRRFTRADALARVADALPRGAATAAEIEALTDDVLGHAVFVPLPRYTDGETDTTPAGPNGQTSRLEADHLRNAATFTTNDVIAVEKTILRCAKASDPEQSRVRLTDRAWIERAVAEAQRDRYPLAEEQLDALMRIVTEGRLIDTVNGVPGSGKTTLMRTARYVMERAGYVVQGAATAAVAAQNLETESGISSRTVASIVHALDVGEEPFRGVDMYVVDEANLTEDRDRARLYAHAAQTGTRIVEIGDGKQLRGVGVGSLFTRVHEIVDGVELRHNRRQAEEDEREAIAAWRRGEYAGALSIWAGKARLVPTETGEEATRALLSRWWDQRQGAPSAHSEMRGLVMLASTNEQVRRLNQAAQAIRLAEHELGAGRTYRVNSGGQLRLHTGDHVLLRLNDRTGRYVSGEPVLNGYRGVVVGIDQRGTVTVEWQVENADGGFDTKRAKLSPAYIARGGVELGYGMTVHKSEGLTVSDQWEHTSTAERAGATVLFHSAGADNPAAHVATSRHCGSVYIFAGRDELETDEDTFVRGVPRTYAELVERITEKLAERAQKTETHGDDRPVVVDLGLAEFATEDGEGRLKAAIHGAERAADERIRTQRHEQWRRAKEERAARREERERRRHGGAAEDNRKRKAAAELLREVWRHEPTLVEQIIAAAAFTAVARNLHDAADAGLDVRDLLADVPLGTVASPRIRDKAAFTASAITVAAQRAAVGEPTASERDAQRREQADAGQQERDQAGDLIREAWSGRPQLADAVIHSPAFGAFVTTMSTAADAGLDVGDLLAAVPVSQVDRDHVCDKGAYATYALKKVVARQADELAAARERAEDRAAHVEQAETTAAMLREVWADHPAAAETIIRGPAYEFLADSIASAQDRGYDVDTVLRRLDVARLAAPGVPSPSGSTAFAFGRAIDALPEPEQTRSSLDENTLAAARRYADRLGQHGPTARGSERDAALDRAGEVNEAAARWLAGQLDAHPEAVEYLRSRIPGVDSVREKFVIGYAPAGQWRALADHLRTIGYSDDDLTAAGLVKPNRHGILIDRFRDRVLVGIRDEHGRIAGFLGRPPREPRENEPKYLNTPATPLFDKSRVVFGLHEGREALTHGATPVLVEGPLDVLALAGCTGADRLVPVASSGTSVTGKHIDAIRRASSVDELVIAFDGDAAGQQAAGRTARMALEAIGTARVVRLPDGHDPASWVAAHPDTGAELYLDATGQQPAAEFVAERAIETYFAAHAPAHRQEVEGQLGAARAALHAIRRADHDTATTTALWIAQRTGADPLTVAGMLADARAELAEPEPEAAAAAHDAPEAVEPADAAEIEPDAGEEVPEPVAAQPGEAVPAALVDEPAVEPEPGEFAELEAGRDEDIMHWAEREFGQLDDTALDRLLAAEQRTLAQLQASRERAEETAQARAEAVAQRQGPQARAVDDNLDTVREQATAVLEAQRIENEWHAVTRHAADTAGQRARLDQQLGELGRFAGRRRAELTEKVEALRAQEERAQRKAGELAEQAAVIQRERGVAPANYDQKLSRARAAEQDYPHARQLAEQRDHQAAAAAQRRADRALETEQQHRQRLDGLQAEHQLRAQLPEAARALESQEREQAAQAAAALDSPTTERQPQPEHHTEHEHQVPEHEPDDLER